MRISKNSSSKNLKMTQMASFFLHGLFELAIMKLIKTYL
jgi:hypothetical protein